MTNEYILRYDTEGEDWQIADMVLLNSSKFIDDGLNAPVMPALILEANRDSIPTDSEIFLVDLNLGNNDNVLDCFSLSDDCPDSKPINKTSVFDFSCKIPSGFNGFNDFTLLNFETIAIYNDPNNNDECIETIILTNDNAGLQIFNNYWVSLEINYCSESTTITPSPTNEPTNKPTEEPTEIFDDNQDNKCSDGIIEFLDEYDYRYDPYCLNKQSIN